ncbi:MAG: hypothetical protein A2156_08685 [Deltaproteobacteria bacterium RBG_16_48_10]|nr:MAG: hypothetical protein A2156_08685 [Deltaproteobacteria bacterium RBG_16_48_10]
MTAFLVLFILRSMVQLFLNELNLFHLRQHRSHIPEVFKGVVDQEKLENISNYSLHSDRFNMLATLVNEGLFLILLLSGFLPWLERMIHGWGWGSTVSGLAFFGFLSVLANLLRIPLSLYDTFVIEDRYGFNTMTMKTWILDLLKSLALLTLLGGFLLWLLLSLMIYGGRMWWLWAWLLVSGFQLLLLWLFPVVIAPLFNKFEPVEDKALEDRIRLLMEKVRIQVKGVFRMDASKRSKHTNAFFTGIGKTKRIVLFDTLLQSHPEEELLAVLAHEAGHWKRRHILKQILLLGILSFILFYGVSKFLDWPLLYETFGFQKPTVYTGLFLVTTILSPLSYFFQPLGAAISRRFEREADDFSSGLMKSPVPLCQALRRLATDNLENLNPHSLYAWFYYSHPPLVERIIRLQNRQNNGR